MDIVAPRAWEKELELGCLIDEAAPAGVVGDEARLRQVLLNLLSNAVKFTERGEVVVLVDAEKTGAGAYRIELAVRDTGIGIPSDRMSDLFTSFSQVDASTTRRFGGTGLGLAISKRLVELMGGTITVESEQGKGSTFNISLAATEADLPAKIALDDGLVHLAGKRILIVDDNATNREIVTRHARSWGMEPVAVELPAAALELIASDEPFDVAVLDMMMPGMDGLALAGEIRNRRNAEELPLLLLTSLGRLPQAESSRLFSAQLAKPFKASQLYNTLLRLLSPDAVDVEAEPVADGKRARSALRILLAEDNAMNQKVALRLLEQLGYRADVANNGLEAIETLERRPYDVVLMDVQMPELDGLDATRRICERWSPESRPHIIAMTANALPEDREACFAAGMDDYVAKPIRAEELVAALKRAKPRPDADGYSEPVEYVSLDDDALKTLRDLGGDDFLGEVIDAFLADAPELVATLRRALGKGGSEELRRAAHTLKSNGATLGATEFAELCRTLEACAKAGELHGAGELRGPDRAGVRLAPRRACGPPVGGGLVSGPAGAAGTILIADDNRVNRLLLARGLEQEGHTVVFAEDGREALDLLRQRRFDLLLLDVLMPELDGYEVLAELQDDPHLRDIPVVVTSALDEIDSVVRCLEMGAEDYLTKPVNPVLLNARINASLEKKRLRDQQRELISKFATKEVAEDLLMSGFSLGGQYVDASAMFCDIRSFTTISESRDPAETIELLNDYYLLMMDAINGEGGIVNQMIGDGLMAIFGAPVPRDDHRQSAVLAARQMVELIRLFNEEQAARDKVQIEIGIGIASGRVVAGYTGTHNRATYTCVGDTVNVAARLETHTKELGRPILIDENTRSGLDDGIALEPQGELLMKGKTEPTKVYAVLADAVVAETA